MDEWETMFAAIQSLAQSAKGVAEGLKQAVTFALTMPELFDEPDFWERMSRYDVRTSAHVVTGWAKAGLENLKPLTGWEFLLLDLGDCPETFRLYRPGGQSLMSEQCLREQMFTETILSEFASCFELSESAAFDKLFGKELGELADHSVKELDDDLLDYYRGTEYDFHGNNGYLLWLTVGSLALLEPLRDPAFCKQILGGRERLYLLSGFEEIFCYLATVTPDGLQFETSLDL